MAQIDVGLLLLVVVGIVAGAGLILALQTAGGRKRLADAGLRLAEALIALAVRWLERNVSGSTSSPGDTAAVGEPSGELVEPVEPDEPDEAYTLACALGALGSLAGRREVLTR